TVPALMDGLWNTSLKLTPFPDGDLFPAGSGDHRKTKRPIAVGPLAGTCKIIWQFYGHCTRAPCPGSLFRGGVRGSEGGRLPIPSTLIRSPAPGRGAQASAASSGSSPFQPGGSCWWKLASLHAAWVPPCARPALRDGPSSRE